MSPMSDATPRPDVAGLVGCAIATVLGIGALFASRDYSPLGSVFPRTIAALMIVFALAYAITTLRRPKPVSRPTAGSTPRRAATMVVMLAWAFALAPVGFLFSSVVASLALLLIANHDRWTARTVLLYGLSMALVLGALYSLFRFALQVPLPVGLFW